MEEAIQYCQHIGVQQWDIATEDFGVVEMNLPGLKIKGEFSVKYRFQVRIFVAFLLAQGEAAYFKSLYGSITQLRQEKRIVFPDLLPVLLKQLQLFISCLHQLPV